MSYWIPGVSFCLLYWQTGLRRGLQAGTAKKYRKKASKTCSSWAKEWERSSVAESQQGDPRQTPASLGACSGTRPRSPQQTPGRSTGDVCPTPCTVAVLLGHSVSAGTAFAHAQSSLNNPPQQQCLRHSVSWLFHLTALGSTDDMWKDH